MPSPNTISAEKLARLLGRPDSPSLIDVRTEEDFDADPRLVPGAVRRSWKEVPVWGPAFAGTGRSAVVICRKGLKLSQGAAAWLRHQGVPSDVLEGGIEEGRGVIVRAEEALQELHLLLHLNNN